MGFFSKIKSAFQNDSGKGHSTDLLHVDIHSHLLPGIDDGAQTMEESVAMIKRLTKHGVNKIITTPHIMYEFYRNTPEIINQKLAETREALQEAGVEVQLEAAAEYYLDDQFMSMLDNKEPLLTFGSNMVLMETNYVQDHPKLMDIFFQLKVLGYTPVFAHPERYMYLQLNKNNYQKYQEIFFAGVLFQVNLMSFTGYYGAQIKQVADYLLKEKMIHIVGSDIHKMEHVSVVHGLKRSKLFDKIMELPLMNNQL